jgi:hypothetical protein
LVAVQIPRHHELHPYELIEKLKKLSGHEVADLLQKEIAQFGFDRLILTGADPDRRLVQQALQYRGPQELFDEFNRRNYAKFDPLWRLKAEEPARFPVFAVLTFVLGAAFLFIEATEFAGMVAQGAGHSECKFYGSQ